MKRWKDAFWLAKYELKKSLKSLILLITMLCFFLVFFVTIIPSYLEKGFAGLDFFFLIIFGLAAGWSKQKEFQIQKVNGDFWASPLFLTLNQLPISKDILIKSRFIIYLVYSIPFNILMLIFIYILSDEMRIIISPTSYIAFILIWVCYGVIIGTSYPTVDIGYKLGLTKQIVHTIFYLVSVMVVLIAFNLFYEDGLVRWTIDVANDWPVITSLISICTMIIYTYLCNKQLVKKIDKIDYLN